MSLPSMLQFSGIALPLTLLQNRHSITLAEKASGDATARQTLLSPADRFKKWAAPVRAAEKCLTAPIRFCGRNLWGNHRFKTGMENV